MTLFSTNYMPTTFNDYGTKSVKAGKNVINLKYQTNVFI